MSSPLLEPVTPPSAGQALEPVALDLPTEAPPPKPVKLADGGTKFFGSRKVQLTLLTTLMGLVPMCLAAAMVFTGKLDPHAWTELTWKLFLAGTGAPGTASVVMRGLEGVAAKKNS
jgi:hypothetical protein